jgi:hypothetical protein
VFNYAQCIAITLPIRQNNYTTSQTKDNKKAARGGIKNVLVSDA